MSSMTNPDRRPRDASKSDSIPPRLESVSLFLPEKVGRFASHALSHHRNNAR
jgi:hypothetical protein